VPVSKYKSPKSKEVDGAVPDTLYLLAKSFTVLILEATVPILFEPNKSVPTASTWLM
jgi:hypothetical protein